MVEGDKVVKEAQALLASNRYELIGNEQASKLITLLHELIDNADAMIHSYEIFPKEDKKKEMYKEVYEHAVQQKQRATNLLRKLHAKAGNIPPASR